MPSVTQRQLLLEALSQAREQLELQVYIQILRDELSNIGLESPPLSINLSSSDSDASTSEADTDNSDSTTSTGSNPDTPIRTDSELSDLSTALLVNYHEIFVALEDEVEKARVLQTRPPSTRIPQLALLDEWKLNNPILFRRKLRVSPEVFANIVSLIQDHPTFHSNSPNPQLPVQIQLAVFLNAAGHYGNAATPQDMAEWAGVSKGTVYNCYKRVMLAILSCHNTFIHFDLTKEKDREDKQKAQRYVEERTCSQWKGGFLCVDGTPFKLFQKPGWHGEGFFDRKSNYSLSNQVSDF